MKDQSHLNTITAAFNLLLIGKPFSGKTVVATSFPQPGIIDCDMKLANAIAFHRQRNPDFAFRYNTVDVDDTGKEVPEAGRWPRFLQCSDERIRDPWVKTIVPDSGTKIATYLTDYLVTQPSNVKPPTVAGMNIMSQSHWYPFATLFQRMITKLIACGKNVIMPVHIRTDKDEVTGTPIYRPSTRC